MTKPNDNQGVHSRGVKRGKGRLSLAVSFPTISCLFDQKVKSGPLQLPPPLAKSDRNASMEA